MTHFGDLSFSAGFRTDVEISGNSGNGEERELEKWEPESGHTGTGIPLGSLEDRSTATTWDQFEVNASRFQVKSTYQEELYTTPLDVTSIPQSVKDKAEQIAREIEAAQFGALDPEKLGEGDLEEDEEARFGAVQGTGAYQHSTGHQQRHHSLQQKGGNSISSPSVQPQPASQSLTSTPFKRPLATPASNPTGPSVSAVSSSSTITSKTVTKKASEGFSTDRNLSIAPPLALATAQNSTSRGLALGSKVNRVGIPSRITSGALSSLHDQLRNPSLAKVRIDSVPSASDDNLI